MKTLIKLACQASLISLVSANMSNTAQAKLDTLLQTDTRLNGQGSNAEKNGGQNQNELNSKKPEHSLLNSLKKSGAALENEPTNAKNGGRRLDGDSDESFSVEATGDALAAEVESGDGKPEQRGPLNFKGKKANDKGFKTFMQSWLATEEEVVAVTLDEEAVLEEATVQEVDPIEDEVIPTNVNRRLQEKAKKQEKVKDQKVNEVKEDKPDSIKDDGSVKSGGSKDDAVEPETVEVTAVEPTTEIIVEEPVVDVFVEEPIVEDNAPAVNRRLDSTKSYTVGSVQENKQSIKATKVEAKSQKSQSATNATSSGKTEQTEMTLQAGNSVKTGKTPKVTTPKSTQGTKSNAGPNSLNASGSKKNDEITKGFTSKDDE